MGANPVTVPPSGKCLAGVQAFQAWYTREWELPSLGCYNPASVLPNGTPSLHRDGRAEDVGHDWSEYQIGLVWELCDRMIANAERLGVQQIIYRQMFWRESGTWRPTSARTDAHWSHAHIEFLPTNAESNTEQDYRETLGSRPMTDDEITKLARAFATEVMHFPVPTHDYTTGKDAPIPLVTAISNRNAELSQIRHHLTGEPLK